MEINIITAFCFILTTLWIAEASLQDALFSLSSEDQYDDMVNWKREAIANNIPYKDGKGLLVYFREVVLTVQHKAQKNAVNFNLAAATTEYPKRDKTVLTLEFPPSRKNIFVDLFYFKMTFERKKMGYYKMTNAIATLKGKDSQSFDFKDVRLFSDVDLTVPKDTSFHCSRFGNLYPLEHLANNHTFTINIKGFQIQAFMPLNQANKLRFVKAYECVGFFTAAIWMGIILSFGFIFILVCGVSMIMAISK